MLRYLLLLLTVIIAVIPAKSQTDSRAGIRFEKQKYNFHKRKAGSQMEYTFTFENTGVIDLTINDVSSSCGCTVPEWSEGPFAPGQSGTIKVVYDSGRIGKFKKELTVYSSAGIVKLYIKGKVTGTPPESDSTGSSTDVAHYLTKFTFSNHFHLNLN